MTYIKKQLHHTWVRFRAVKPAYLVLALLLVGTISVFALRHNNQRMLELRQAVYTADEQGGDVEAALRKLRDHVHSHMNTDLSSGSNAVYPPIQLKHTYERLVAAGQEKVRQDNATIYTEAQAYCERRFPDSFSGGPRVPCIQNYVSERGGKVATVPDSLYKFDFVSPVWSPDVAGWSLVIALTLAVLLLVRLITPRILKRFNI